MMKILLMWEETTKRRVSQGILGGINRFVERKTEDGVNVYSEESLNLHKNKVGGGTAQCPFDCDCCF